MQRFLYFNFSVCYTRWSIEIEMYNYIIILSVIFIIEASGQAAEYNQYDQYPPVKILPREYYDDLTRRTKPCPDNKQNSYLNLQEDTRSAKPPRIDLDKEILSNYMKAAREHLEQEASINKIPQNVPLKQTSSNREPLQSHKHASRQPDLLQPDHKIPKSSENLGHNHFNGKHSQERLLELPRVTEKSYDYPYVQPTLATANYQNIPQSTSQKNYINAPTQKIDDSNDNHPVSNKNLQLKDLHVDHKSDELQPHKHQHFPNRKSMDSLEEHTSLEHNLSPSSNDWHQQDLLVSLKLGQDDELSTPKQQHHVHKHKPEYHPNDELKNYETDNSKSPKEDADCQPILNDEITGSRRAMGNGIQHPLIQENNEKISRGTLLVKENQLDNYDIVPSNQKQRDSQKTKNRPNLEKNRDSAVSVQRPKGERTNTNVQDESHFLAPSKAILLSDINGPRTMLMDSSRICYACSSVHDPTCWYPSKSTTIKYCKKGNDSCLLKTYRTEDSRLVVIRDCGSSCDSESSIKYESCGICKSNLCNNKNGAPAINSFNAIALIFSAIIIKHYL